MTVHNLETEGVINALVLRIWGSGAQKGEVAAVATLHCHSV